jgi:hypothetical protein
MKDEMTMKNITWNKTLTCFAPSRYLTKALNLFKLLSHHLAPSPSSIYSLCPRIFHPNQGAFLDEHLFLLDDNLEDTWQPPTLGHTSLEMYMSDPKHHFSSTWRHHK